MTQPEEWMIRPAFNTVHTNLADQSQLAILDASQMASYTEWSQNVATRTGLADGSIPVVGTMAAGTVNSKTVGVGPPTSVAVSTENMLVSQNFSSSDTVVALRHWSWNGEDGNLTLGCAQVMCDGTQDDLVSNEIPVIQGESISVSCQVKWESITYTGTDPIVLGIQKYRQGKDPDTGGVIYLDVGGVDVASLESPAASGGWGTDGDLAGIYVVEPGVDQLRFRFKAAPTLTVGTVKWDEAVFLKLDRIADAAVPGVGTTVDDIVIELFGTEGDSFTHNEAALALANTAASILSLNARLSESEAGESPGAIAGDDFLWTGEITTSANWGGGYQFPVSSGFYTANGSDAIWGAPDGSSLEFSQKCWFDWQGTGDESDTDYQLIQLLLSSAPVTHQAGFKAYVHVLGRVSTGFGSYVRAGFGSDGTYFVDYTLNSGASFTTMSSGSCAVPGAGTLISLYCGEKATTLPRRYKLTANQTVIANFNESGSSSPMGAANLKWGWGAEDQGGYWINGFFGDFGQGTPAKINQWLGYDQ